jgi:hypothetical protein
MVTTIKVTDETKQLLDMIQARITLARHKKMTLTELIDAMTQLALKHEDELFKIEESAPPQKEPEVKPSIVKTPRNSKVEGVDVYTEE